MLSRVLTFAAVCLSTAAATAQTGYPMLMSVKPVAVQTGQTSEVTVSSRYSMYGAYKVWVSGSGVQAEVLPHAVKEGEKVPSLTKIKLKFIVEKDALPGVRDYRIATPNGASTTGQIVIASDPVQIEKEGNNTLDAAASIKLPATICGGIETNEDVDLFKFTISEPTSLSFHVRAMRLQDRLHDMQRHVDPIITVKNASGSTLAANDNYFFGDSYLSHKFDRPGDYFLEVRDVRYHGNQYWQYSIEVTNRPFITNIHPMGIAKGQSSQLELVGANIPESPFIEFAAPGDLPESTKWLQLPLANGKSNSAPVVVHSLQPIVEAETDNNSIENAQPITFPAGISGRIETENDIDFYSFEAKKGDLLSFEIIARRRQSALDSHLRILNEKGNQVQLNDDLRVWSRSHADSWIENYSIPADGKYFIEIRDVHLRGGASYVYFLKFTRSVRYFELYMDTDKTQLTPGTGGVVFVRTVRKNGFAGDIQLGVNGLPAGVKATCGRILSGGTDGCIIFEAAPDAEMNMSNIEITGTTQPQKDAKVQLTSKASPFQETYMPGGGRGHWPVLSHAISVGKPNDILAVELNTTEISLKPGESKKIEVKIKRAETLKSNITLDVRFRHLSSTYGNSLPAGVTLDGNASKTLLTAKESAGHIVLKCADNAKPVEKQQISVMANVSLNFVMKATYSSKPVFVSVMPK